MLTALGRGLTAGAVGGALAGLFGYLLAEPLMDRAVELEAARAAAAGDVGVETFTRSTQHVGFVVATLAVGLAFGVLYGVTYRLVHPDDGADAWGRAVRLGAGAFFGVSLVPFLRYPANPPGVGDGATIDSRTHLYEVSLVIGLVGAVLAGVVANSFRDKGIRPSVRHLAVTAVLVATVTLTFVLPDITDPIEAPVHLIWDFRLLFLGTTLLLWGGIAATFGLLAERAARRTAAG